MYRLVAGMTIILLAASTSAAQPASPVAAANNAFIDRNYPPEALKRGEQGRVGFELSIEKDGSVSACKTVQSSGYEALDQGTCELLIRSVEVKPVTDAQGNRVRATKSGYILWTLPATATASPPAQATAAAASEPLVCKRTLVPGSLIKRVKRCMTPSEWALDERMVREQVESYLGRQYCGDHGCF